MATAYRADFWGLYFMPETTAGTNPGICAASDVNGTAESYKYQPQVGPVDGFGTGGARRAFVRLAEKPSGLPVVPLVDIPQVWQTNDYDVCKTPGLRSEGEFSITMNLTGTIADAGSAADTSRPVPPPWMRLAGSACSRIIGYRSAHSGGLVDTINTPTDADTYTVTFGNVDEGHVHGIQVTNSTFGASTFELVRPTNVASGTSVSAASYNGGTAFGTSATATAGDVVSHAVQFSPDKREEANSESFTMLFVRPIANATTIVKGCRCSKFEITSEVGKVPTIKMSFIFESWAVYGVYPSEFDTTPPVLAEEPAYYTNWPCPHITADAKFVYQLPHATAGSRVPVRNVDINGIKISWTSGFKRRMAVTGAQGVADILASDKGKLEVSFTTTYRDDWRAFMGACCAGTVQETFPIYYWENNAALSIWFIAIASAYLLEDPGLDKEWDNVMAQEIKLGVRKYDSDNGAFTAGTTVDTKFAIGIL